MREACGGLACDFDALCDFDRRIHTSESHEASISHVISAGGPGAGVGGTRGTGPGWTGGANVADAVTVVTILVTGKCVAACRRAVLLWARRGKICRLYQDGGARDVRYSSDASTGCSLAILETHCGGALRNLA